MRLSPLWRERLAAPALRRLALGLAVGGLGGALADWAEVPLAWMLGALFFCMAASVAGLPVGVPMWLRAWFFVLVGLFLGESFDGLALAELARWPITIAGAILYVPIAGGAAYVYYRYGAREERLTAVCSAIPGGLSGVVLISEQIGADERAVALSQSLRISIVIFLAPVIAFGLLDLPEPTDAMFSARPPIGLGDAAVLLAGALAATWALARAAVPIPFFIGPILASAILRISGLVEGALPHMIVEGALVVTGSAIGCRFAGVELGRLWQVARRTFFGTLVLMAVTAVFAAAMAPIGGVDYFTAVLAYAPGGVAEMSLIALAIDTDPAFVAFHHVVRIAFILLAIPFFARWLAAQSERGRAAGE